MRLVEGGTQAGWKHHAVPHDEQEYNNIALCGTSCSPVYRNTPFNPDEADHGRMGPCGRCVKLVRALPVLPEIGVAP